MVTPLPPSNYESLGAAHRVKGDTGGRFPTGKSPSWWGIAELTEALGFKF